MKRKGVIIISIYSLIAIVCILTAIFYEVQFAVSVLGYPYELLSRLIKVVDNNGSNPILGWIFYFVFALSPVAYLIISIIKHKKFFLSDLLFVIFIIFHSFALYVFINPTLFINTYFGDLGKEVVKDNVAFMSYLSLFLWLLICIRKNLKNKEEKSFVYAKRALYFMIGFLIFNILYVNLSEVINGIRSIEETSSNRGLGIFYAILLAVLSSIPLAINIVVCFKLVLFFDSSKDNIFEQSNQDSVNNISKWIFIYLVAAVVCLIFKNMASLIVNKELMTLKAELSLDLISILSLFFFGCLFVFLRQSYEIKEENDLTI